MNLQGDAPGYPPPTGLEGCTHLQWSGGRAAAVADGGQGGDGGADLFGRRFERFPTMVILAVQLNLRAERERDVIGAGEGFDHPLHPLAAVEVGREDRGAALEGEKCDAALK